MCIGINALRTNGYTEWALVIPKQKGKTKSSSANSTARHPSIGLPYVQSLSERRAKTFPPEIRMFVYEKSIPILREKFTEIGDEDGYRSISQYGRVDELGVICYLQVVEVLVKNLNLTQF